MSLAYVYKWTHKPTMQWYVGSRTETGCRPDDGYICSSKIVKPMIKASPDDWERTIVATGTADEMYDLETEILDLMDARNDERSFNQHNNEGGKFRLKKHSEESKKKIRSNRVYKSGPDNHKWGKKCPAQSAAIKGISMKHKGKPWSQSRREAQKLVQQRIQERKKACLS